MLSWKEMVTRLIRGKRGGSLGLILRLGEQAQSGGGVVLCSYI